MPQRSNHPLRRSPIEWSARIVLALTAAVLGYSAVVHSLAMVLRTVSPEQAHALAAWDGRITASLSEKFSELGAGAAQRAEANRLALLALRQDATAVAAVATLGLNAQARGDIESARRFFAYSDKLSRRDLRTRLWGIEDAVARDDIPNALRQYDIALRTSRSAPDLLYPVLASAIADADIATALVKTLATRPAWTQSFIEFAAGNGTDPRATAQLFREVSGAAVPISDSARAMVINRLIARQLFDDAWAYYSSYSHVDRRRARDPQFTVNLSTPSPFDWVPMGGDSGIATSIQGNAQRGVFDFSAPASVGGVLLQQMQMLPPGDYLIEGRSAGIDQPEGSRPYWALTCLEGRELSRLTLPNSAQDEGMFRGRLAVPSGCPVQYLRLVARPSNSVGGLSGQINEVALLPVN